ncbi:MAG: DegT/DnrJ/EryC1/StrS family aminotransferase [Candidatus Omnitrophica bacterium]|nr:DegT/DnrJ/EryC1/StrS family aminotransferase [Candidatus Omnitrophota bacterium]
MRVPFIDLAVSSRGIQEEIRKAVNRVLDSQRFILDGSVAALEEKIARDVGAKYAVGTASGSDALYLSLLALGVGAGDEVITTPFTFFATAGAVSRTGARPVFVDIDPHTFNLNPSLVEERINRKTKAIVPVHLFGLLCEMDSILRIARRHSLLIVEDAAQAYGAGYRGKKAGSWGDAGCFSFYPTKNLGGAGDGGMVVTSSAGLARKLKLLRDHGSARKYHHEEIGVNSRLDELQAAVLLVKLKYLKEWNEKRRFCASVYGEGLKDSPLQIPKSPAGNRHVYHLYSILSKKRDALARFLAGEGIGTGIYYPLPLHLQPCYRSLGGKKGDFPVAERTTSQILSLPMYPGLAERDVRFVMSKVHEFCDGRADGHRFSAGV